MDVCIFTFAYAIDQTILLPDVLERALELLHVLQHRLVDVILAVVLSAATLFQRISALVHDCVVLVFFEVLWIFVYLDRRLLAEARPTHLECGGGVGACL
jgi:hypothetical protein